jgi:hypothetical protein
MPMQIPMSGVPRRRLAQQRHESPALDLRHRRAEGTVPRQHERVGPAQDRRVPVSSTSAPARREALVTLPRLPMP